MGKWSFKQILRYVIDEDAGSGFLKLIIIALTDIYLLNTANNHSLHQ